MPYKLIKGTFHLTGMSRAGNPTGFQPDGDSLHFRPNNLNHLDDLEQVGRQYRLTGINSTNLRFEGIDATELHFGGSRQPSPIAEDARDYLTGRFGMNPVTYRSNGVTVQPPANDGQPGFILSKQLDVHGRPVAFVHAGTDSRANGSWVHVGPPLLRQSLNYRLLRRGLAYPLFYDTLYYDLRETMRSAAISAFNADSGLWPSDATNTLTRVSPQTRIETVVTLYPKLFRRLTDYYKAHTTFTQANFVSWLDAASENDEVWIRPEWNRTHLDNVVEVRGQRLQMTRYPEDLVFVSRT